MSIIFPGRLRNATQATSRSKLFPIQLLRCGESLNLITLNFRDYNRVCPFVSPAWWVEKSFGKAETPRLCGVENQEVCPLPRCGIGWRNLAEWTNWFYYWVVGDYPMSEVDVSVDESFNLNEHVESRSSLDSVWHVVT